MEESLEVGRAEYDSAFLFKLGFIFGDFVLSVLDALVKFVNPPSDCVDWRAFLN